jgi:hypothetical protein
MAAGDAVARGRWVEEHLGYADWQDIVLGDAPLLAESLAAERPLVAWVSFREARSYAGFLWWLSRIGDLPCAVINVPDLSIPPGEDMIPLLGLETPIATDERARRRDQWRALKAENSPLRVIERRVSSRRPSPGSIRCSSDSRHANGSRWPGSRRSC